MSSSFLRKDDQASIYMGSSRYKKVRNRYGLKKLPSTSLLCTGQADKQESGELRTQPLQVPSARSPVNGISTEIAANSEILSVLIFSLCLRKNPSPTILAFF